MEPTTVDQSSGHSRVSLASIAMIALAISVGGNVALISKLSTAQWPSEPPRPLEPGTSVLPFRAADDNGNSVMVNYQTDRPTVLYFFSPSCGWCERNWSNIRSLANETKGKYRFVLVSTEYPETAFLTSRGLTFAEVLGGLSLARRWRWSCRRRNCRGVRRMGIGEGAVAGIVPGH